MGFWDDEEDEVELAEIAKPIYEGAYQGMREIVAATDVDCVRAKQDLDLARQNLAAAKQRLAAAKAKEDYDPAEVQRCTQEVEQAQASVFEADARYSAARQQAYNRSGLNAI